MRLNAKLEEDLASVQLENKEFGLKLKDLKKDKELLQSELDRVQNEKQEAEESLKKLVFTPKLCLKIPMCPFCIPPSCCTLFYIMRVYASTSGARILNAPRK